MKHRHGFNFSGVCHGDDMIYLFDRKINGDLVLGPLTEDDLTVREIMANAWTNFAKFGSPNNFGRLTFARFCVTK